MVSPRNGSVSLNSAEIDRSSRQCSATQSMRVGATSINDPFLSSSFSCLGESIGAVEVAAAEMSGGTTLSEAETRAVSALLAQAWGPGAEIRGVAPIWRRSNVLGLQVVQGRSVVMKRRGEQAGERQARIFGIELAALEYLNAMPAAVAPRLVAAGAQAGIPLMEEP